MPAPAAPKRGKTASAQKSRRTNRQADVMQAAKDIFWQKGYQAASIQDIADKVGVLKGSLYYYIESKEDLLWAIMEDVHVKWHEILEDALALDERSVEQIRILIQRHIEWYLANVKEVSVFFHEWRHLTGARLKTVTARRREYEQIFRDLIAAAQEAGDIAQELDLHYAARYVLAAVNAVPDWYRASAGAPAVLIADAYAEMTVGMLTGTPRRARPRRSRRAA